MKITWITNKEGYWKLLAKLKDIEESRSRNSRKKYLSLPETFKRVGGAFSMRKEEIWNRLFLLRDFGLIEIIPFHGVRLLYEVVDND